MELKHESQGTGAPSGVLVGGDNSKMSVLEKLARLALEN